MNRERDTPDRSATTPDQPPKQRASRFLDVLVVEDNPVNQKFVVGLLAKWGHRAVVACDGVRGLEALAHRNFDLVLMDVQMPVMDGIEATCSIRTGERERGGHVPIIAITAHAAIQDRARCLEAGVDRYLTKPMNSELLRQAIAELFPMAAWAPILLLVAVTAGHVDFEQIRTFVGDDPALLADVVQIFLEDTPATVARATRAIADADSRSLEALAHRLKGSLSTMGAASTAETAKLLESMGRDGVLDGAAELCERLSREVAAVSASLRLWMSQAAA
jgi:two-component system sensor histidine kinase/response regulator